MKQSLEIWPNRFRSFSFWLAVGLGSGLIKPAPGTWGSLFALLLGYSMMVNGVSVELFIAAIVGVSVLGTVTINRIEKQSGVHDAPEIVIDEVAGMWIAMLPLYHLGTDYITLLLAFALFRVFDIVKPWPIGWLDKQITGGFGVMVDDIVAGIFAVLGIEIFAALLLQ